MIWLHSEVIGGGNARLLVYVRKLL